MMRVSPTPASARSKPDKTTPVVSVRDLRVRFVTREGTVRAVNGVSFDLVPGEVLGILGESGSGKSVTLRALMGLWYGSRAHVEGEIRVAGLDVNRLSEAETAALRGRTIAMIFQEPMLTLDPVYTIGEQIEETIIRHEGLSHRAARARALELLEMVQIPGSARRLKAYPHEMSGGMRQRAMIAIALSCRPAVLLADEPTTALDVTVQIQILLLLRKLQQEFGMAVIFVTHDVGVSVEVADRLAVMYAGRFVETGPMDAVIRAPRHPYTQGLLASTVHGSFRDRRLEAIPGMPPSLSELAPGCAFAPRCRYAEDRCLAADPPEHRVTPGHAARCVRAADGSLSLPASGPSMGRADGALTSPRAP
jgi:peptide/nickel transport system ATP-binding protein